LLPLQISVIKIFLNRNYRFTQVSSDPGSIINDGQIIAANHGL
jgi:hypothetical protein